MKNEKYEIETIEDIANCVNITNIENFLEGFGQGLRAYITAVAIGRQASREQGKDDAKLKNSQIIVYEKLTYIDDGKQENKINILKKK